MPGVYNINIKNNIVSKTLNHTHSTARYISHKIKNDDNYKLYQECLNSYKLPIIGRFISPPLSIERNGTYSMDFIDGITLMDILPNHHPLCKIALWNSKSLKFNKNTCINIIRGLSLLMIKLHQYSRNNSLRGDWFLHNLMYQPTTNKIYNVDLEGFFTYYGDNPMCDLKKYVPRQFNACKKELLNQIGSQLFSIILWNPVKKYYDEIKEFIQSKFTIVLNKDHHIDDMKLFVDKVYELDVRCHKPYLPKKIEILEKYEKQLSFFLILIDEIRNKYKSKLENYYKDIIIHVSDNATEAENIYQLIL